jgi:hypothetical protein
MLSEGGHPFWGQAVYKYPIPLLLLKGIYPPDIGPPKRRDPILNLWIHKFLRYQEILIYPALKYVDK